MVKEICLTLLLVASLILCCVTAFHPVPKSLAPKTSDGETVPANAFPNEDGNSAGSIPMEQFKVFSLEDELEKRGQDKNFLRFGKADHPMMTAMYFPSDVEDLTEEEKRNSRNFLRFGRVPQRNFLRFGKSSPLQFGLGIEPDSTDELWKGGVDSENFLRFGKAADRNFLRFGRSTEAQKANDCVDCLHNKKQDSDSLSLPRKRGNNYLSPEANSLSKKPRTKRSVSAFYDDGEFFPQSSMAWASQYNSLDEVPRPSHLVAGNEDDINNIQKRAHGRSFLRYGRDPLDLHFLRFGKRSSSEENKSFNDDTEDAFNRYMRGRSSKNFLRFG